MRKHIFIYLLAGSFVLMYMTGCEYLTESVEPISVVQVDAAPLINPRNEGEDSSARVAAHGANDFAFRLSAALMQDVEDENFVVSPYSAWLPLAALVNATDEAYQQELLTAIGASGISVDDLNQAASRMLFDLTNGHNQEIQIANAIFVDHQRSLRGDFAQNFMDFYRGSVINVDFQSPETVNAVNTWARDHTEGLITDLIQEFNPETVATIANAIYFSDNWLWEFNPDRTTLDTFYAPTEKTTAYFMVRTGQDQLYFEDESLQATRLGFQTGGGMYILLPKSGDVVDLLASMTSESFEYIQNNATLHEGRLLLPRFSIENTIYGLDEALQELGVPLFDEIAAPLTDGLFYDDTYVWLSNAIQQAMIEIDEQGATAAAVTIMDGDDDDSAAPEPQEPFEMICNRPFAFVLYRRTYDGDRQIIFTGVVNQP